MPLPFEREIRFPPQRPPLIPGRERHVIRWMLLVILLLLFLVPIVATRYTDWLWYRDIGFERVFLTKIAAQWTLGLVAGVVGFVAVYLNARIALRGVATKNLHIRDASEWVSAGPRVFVERLASWLVAPVSLLLGLMLAVSSASAWRDLAMFFYRTPFGVSDPVFGRDVAYYVFTIPMVENVLSFASVTLWLSLLLLVLPIYVARTDIGGTVVAAGRSRQITRFYVTPRAQMHVAILVALLLAVSAV